MDKAFTKGLRLLEVLARSDKPRGITDLAKELEFTKSNVHRLLATLQAQGFVRQMPPPSRASTLPMSSASRPRD